MALGSYILWLELDIVSPHYLIFLLFRLQDFPFWCYGASRFQSRVVCALASNTTAGCIPALSGRRELSDELMTAACMPA